MFFSSKGSAEIEFCFHNWIKHLKSEKICVLSLLNETAQCFVIVIKEGGKINQFFF